MSHNGTLNANRDCQVPRGPSKELRQSHPRCATDPSVADELRDDTSDREIAMCVPVYAQGDADAKNGTYSDTRLCFGDIVGAGGRSTYLILSTGDGTY